MKTTPLFSNIDTGEKYYDEVSHATYKGVAIKTLILLALTVGIAVAVGIALPKILVNQESLPIFIGVLIGAAIIALISAIIGRLTEKASKYFSVIYALSEGLLLGTATALAEEFLAGAGWIALATTLSIYGIMLILFATGILRVGTIFRRVIIAMSLAIVTLSIATIIVAFTAPTIQQYLIWIIIVEAFLLIYGVITLAFNFEEANMVVKNGCSKDAEWSVALGMEISLVYIYIQVLRLLVYIAALVGKNN